MLFRSRENIAKKNKLIEYIQKYHQIHFGINVLDGNTSSPINQQISKYEDDILKILKTKGYRGNTLNNTRYEKNIFEIIDNLNTNETEELLELFDNIEDIEEEYYEMNNKLRDIINDINFNFNEKNNSHSSIIQRNKETIIKFLKTKGYKSNTLNKKELNIIIDSFNYDEIKIGRAHV